LDTGFLRIKGAARRIVAALRPQSGRRAAAPPSAKTRKSGPTAIPIAESLTRFAWPPE